MQSWLQNNRNQCSQAYIKFHARARQDKENRLTTLFSAAEVGRPGFPSIESGGVGITLVASLVLGEALVVATGASVVVVVWTTVVDDVVSGRVVEADSLVIAALVASLVLGGALVVVTGASVVVVVWTTVVDEVFSGRVVEAISLVVTALVAALLVV